MNSQTSARVISTMLIILSGVALYFFIRDAITPDMVRDMNPESTVNYIYVHDNDQYHDRDHKVEIKIFPGEGDISVERVLVHLKKPGESEYIPVEMETSTYMGEPTSSFIYMLPRLPILDRYFYYLTLELSDGSSVKITQPKPWIVRLLSGNAEWPFWVTFEGHVNKDLLVLHIALVVGGAIFLLHTLLYAMFIHAGLTGVMPKALSSMIWGWLWFMISVIPLGVVVTWQAFREGWGGWPIGTDITDSKSEVVVLYWLITYLLARSGKTGERTFVWMVYFGALLTTIVYLIPHSLFFVKW